MIYLDYNCFQRGFDDSRQFRIRMEALACEEIFARAEDDTVELVWSFMHEDETRLCPFQERKVAVLKLAALCKVRVGPREEIRELARSFQLKCGLASKDALHLACAHHIQVAVFLTCDDNLIKQARRLKLRIQIANPVDYVRREMTE